MHPLADAPSEVPDASENEKNEAQVPDASEDEANEAARGYFRMRCLAQSPHPRAALEQALETLSGELRQCPTLPADPEDQERPWMAARSEESAVLLPAKHCAFRSCDWCSANMTARSDTLDQQLLDHLLGAHMDSLRP